MNSDISIKESVGNLELLKLTKIAFLCSRKIPASAVLKCYDWAIAQREEGNCVISGFHSKLEKDVFHYLLKGSQPVIMMLARGLKQKLDPVLKKNLDQGRLLIISPFAGNVKRVTERTSETRNKAMIEIADRIIVGFVSENGQLHKILKSHMDKVSYI